MKTGLPYNVLAKYNSWDNVPRDPVSVGSILLTGSAAAGAAAVGAAALGYSIVGYIATSLVTSWALAALTPKPDFGAANSGTILKNSINGVAEQDFVYGKVRKGGIITFYESTGDDNTYLHQIICLAGHEVNSIGDIYINDQVATFSGDFVTTTGSGDEEVNWGSKIRIKKYDGSQTTADADLVSETSVDSNFKGLGVAYLYVRYEYDQEVFASGVPTVTAVVEGKEVYDPRDTTTAYSNNASLCIRDYIVSAYGLSDTSVDDVYFSAAANECDENITLSGGGTENRYEINGIVQSGRPTGDVLGDMVTSCAGSLFWGSGNWRLKVGAYSSPVKTLTLDDLRSPISLDTRTTIRDNFNFVTGTFNDASQNWVTADYPKLSSSTDAGSFVVGDVYTITDAGNTNFAAIGASSNTVGVTFTATGVGSGTGKASAFLGQDNGEESSLDLPLPFTTSASAAQRLAKLTLFRGREQMTFSADFGLEAFNVEVGDIVGFTNERYGFTAKEFEVVGWNFASNQDAGDLRVTLTLRETSEAAFDWNAEEVAITSNDTTLPKISSGTNILGLALSDGGSEVQGDGTVENNLLASWTASTNAFTSYYEVEWGQTSSVNKTTFTTSDNSVLLSPVVDGVEYTAKVRSVSVTGYRGSYSSATGTSGGDTTAPSLPTSVSATGGYKYITISWTNPTNADLSHVKIYENSSNTTTGATVVGTSSGDSFVRTNLGLDQTKYYFLKAVDFSGNESGFTSATSATTEYIDNADFENGVRQLFIDQDLDVIAPVSSLPASGDFTGQQVFLTTDGKLYRWNGSAWGLTLAAADGGDITNATITGDKVVANTITGGLLATSGIITNTAQMNDAVIETAKIKDLSVERIKIADNAVSNRSTDTVVNQSITSNYDTSSPTTLLSTSNFAAVGGLINLTNVNVIFRPSQSQLIANGTDSKYGVLVHVIVGTATVEQSQTFVKRSDTSGVNVTYNLFTLYQRIGSESMSLVIPWIVSSSANYNIQVKINCGYFTSTGAWGSQTISGSFDGALETDYLAK